MKLTARLADFITGGLDFVSRRIGRYGRYAFLDAKQRELGGVGAVSGYGLTECSPVVSISPIDISRMREIEFTGSIGVRAGSRRVMMAVLLSGALTGP